MGKKIFKKNLLGYQNNFTKQSSAKKNHQIEYSYRVNQGKFQ